MREGKERMLDHGLFGEHDDEGARAVREPDHRRPPVHDLHARVLRIERNAHVQIRDRECNVSQSDVGHPRVPSRRHRSGCDDELSIRLARAELGESHRHVVEGIALVHDRFDRSLGVELEQRAQHLGHSLGILYTVTSPVEPHHRDVLQQNAVRFDFRDATAREPDHEQTPIPGDALQRLIEDVAPDRIVDDVSALSVREFENARDEVFGSR